MTQSTKEEKFSVREMIVWGILFFVYVLSILYTILELTNNTWLGRLLAELGGYVQQNIFSLFIMCFCAIGTAFILVAYVFVCIDGIQRDKDIDG